MANRNPTPSGYNRWFIWLFLIWVIVGAVIWMAFSRKEIFETINGHHTTFVDGLMHGYTNLGDGMAITFLLLILFGAPAFRNLWFVTTAVACNVLPALLVQLIKLIVAAPRPLRYWENDANWIYLADGWHHLTGHHSFPSGHTAGAFSLFCFLALLLPKRMAPIGILFFFAALLVGYSRMYLAAHFYADVYVGSIVGTIATLGVFATMRRMQPRFYGRNEKATTLDDDHDDRA